MGDTFTTNYMHRRVKARESEPLKIYCSIKLKRYQR